MYLRQAINNTIMKTDGAVNSSMNKYLSINGFAMGRKTPNVLSSIKFIDDKNPSQAEIQEIIYELEILHDSLDDNK